MKRHSFLILCLLAIALSTTVQAKQVIKPVIYMFGFSASFQDSIIYMTDIQEVRNVAMDTKTKFLLGRDMYSDQLKTYLTQQGLPHRVCLVVFAETRKDAEKKFIKMRSKYVAPKKKKKQRAAAYDIRYLTTSDFHFESIVLDN